MAGRGSCAIGDGIVEEDDARVEGEQAIGRSEKRIDIDFFDARDFYR